MIPFLDNVSWYAGPLLVLFGVSLCVLLVSVGFLFIIPCKPRSPWERTGIVSALVVGLINLLARYALAVGTNPGTNTSAAFAKVLKGKSMDEVIVETTGGSRNPKKLPQLLAWSKCRHTGVLKPPRAHYDSVNGAVVMNFDHWCPWLFNSVGYGNYRHFFMFLFWVWLMTSFGALMSIEPMLDVLQEWEERRPGERSALLVEFILCFVLSLTVGSLFGWHVYLAMTAQTSVDFLVLKGRRRKIDPDMPNPFDSGSAYVNLRNVVLSKDGSWLELLIPPWPRSMPNGKPFPGAWADEDDLLLVAKKE